MRFPLLLLAPFVWFAVRGEEPSREKEAANPVREEYQKAAKKYEFFLDKERKVPLALEPKPIFSWAQDDDWNGDLFVWSVKAGRSSSAASSRDRGNSNARRITSSTSLRPTRSHQPT